MKKVVIFTAFLISIKVYAQEPPLPVSITVDNGIQTAINDELSTRYISLFITSNAYPAKKYQESGVLNVDGNSFNIKVWVDNQILYGPSLSLSVNSSTGRINISISYIQISAEFTYLIDDSGGLGIFAGLGYFSFDGSPNGSPLIYVPTVSLKGDININPYSNTNIGLTGGQIYRTITYHDPILLGQFEPYRNEIENKIKELISLALSKYLLEAFQAPIENALRSILDTENPFIYDRFTFTYKGASISANNGILKINYSTTITSTQRMPDCSTVPSNPEPEEPPSVNLSAYNFGIGFSGKYLVDILFHKTYRGKLCGQVQAKGTQFFGIFPELLQRYYSYQENFYDELYIYYSPPQSINFEAGSLSGDPPGYLNIISMPVNLWYNTLWEGGTFFKGTVDIRIPIRFKGNNYNYVTYQLDLYEAEVQNIYTTTNIFEIDDTRLTTFLKYYVIPLIFKPSYTGNLTPILFKKGPNSPSPFMFHSDYRDTFSGSSGVYTTDIIMEEELPSDSQKPTVQFTSVPSPEFNKNQVDFSFSGNDNLTPPTQIRYSWRIKDASGNIFPWSREIWEQRDGGGIYNVQISYVSEGPLTIEIKGSDNSKNTSDIASASFTVDTVPPISFITQGPEAFYQPDTFHFEFTAEDFFHSTNSISFSYKMDNDQWSSFGFINSADIYLSDMGAHTFYVRGKDPAGNIGEPVTWTFNVDSEPPETEIIRCPQQYTKGKHECFYYSATDTIQKDNFEFYYSMNSSTFTGPENLTTQCFDNLKNGDYVFNVYAVDKSGNADPTPDTCSFTVDREPPTLNVDRISPPYDPDIGPEEAVYGENILEFSLQATDNVIPSDQLNYLFSVNDGYPIEVSSFIRYDHLDKCAKNGLYTFIFKAIDRAGNVTTRRLDIYIDCREKIIFGGQGCGVTGLYKNYSFEENLISLILIYFGVFLTLWVLSKKRKSFF